MIYTPSQSGRQVLITDAPDTPATPVPPFLAGLCPACREPLARPGTVARYHKWYHEACLPPSPVRAPASPDGQRRGPKMRHPDTHLHRVLVYVDKDTLEYLERLPRAEALALKREAARVLSSAEINSRIF